MNLFFLSTEPNDGLLTRFQRLEWRKSRMNKSKGTESIYGMRKRDFRKEVGLKMSKG